MSTRDELKRVISSISKEEIESEIDALAADPKRLQEDLDHLTDNLSDDDIQEGIEEYGGAEQFMNTLLLFLAFKAALIRKGIAVGVASGAGAVALFGAGAMGHAVANATGIEAIDDIACGIDCAGDLALDVSDVGFAVAESGVGFFEGLLDGVLSLFG